MDRLFSVLPVAGLAAGAALALAALASNASAQACRVDSSDGSCKSEGAACTPAGGAAGGGRCKTTQPNVREYVCVCAKRGPAPRSDPDRPRPRDNSPYDEPTEEQEPQEPQG